ncbi:MAG: ribosome small subunit-dependent GTPase A [Candidatus Pacebacteria bacterium]|nr:ribosome small subunit-dependent GTPase A [Candidatus Paceibacterota bacterium]
MIKDFSKKNIARVIGEYRGAYKVKGEGGDYLARVTGSKMFKSSSREDFPAVGDFVETTNPIEGDATIIKILPRKTIIKRKYNNKNEVQIIATNIDVAFIVESVNKDFNLNRFERYFAIAKTGGVKPVIVLNKIDLISKEELERKSFEIKERFKDIDFIKVSTISEEGLKELKEYIEKGKTYCFLGSSGVGKSSLINKLLDKELIKTKSVSSRNDKGKHTTTNRQMYFLKDGGIVIDNPGMREVGMAETNEGIDNFFDLITNLAKDCKYADCTHVHEPNCRVLLALKNGEIKEEQYSNYINLKKEAEFFEMTKQEKREKDYQFGKFIKKAKKDLENL